ncbi:acetylornithine/succinylornithine family transaminase [bacterium]|nr:acetylornithine/succinylornithine family transaminase [bacterium]
MIPAVLPVYNRTEFGALRGEGVYLHTDDGRTMLDFASGIAVNSLGHCHPHLVAELKKQAETLWHVSNLYQIPGQQKLAERLVAVSCCDTAFFCNSGAEAMEAAFKMTRKYFDFIGQPDRYRIITMKGGFHGRTIATISAASKPALTDGFAPLLDGFDHVELNDLAAVKAAIGPQTAAIALEPIQGEGGIRPATKEFLQGLAALCKEHGLLLIADEVQCGTGRTGKMFAYEWAGVEPDLIAVAKGIGGGFPLGACLAKEHVAKAMNPGSHGGTYGGNPLAMAVGNAVMDIITAPGFLAKVTEMGDYLGQKLEALKAAYPKQIDEIRGKGLMRGLRLHSDPAPFVKLLREEGLLTVGAADQAIRIVPPLIVEKAHIDEAVDKIDRCCKKLAAASIAA